MAYFPFFIDLDHLSGLIVGGGQVALEKAKRLLPYGPSLTVMAPTVLPELTALDGVTVRLRAVQESDLDDGPAFVLAATDSREENHRIAALCRNRSIPVNAADAPEDCTFLFPALLRAGRLSVGVSTGGASPTAAGLLRDGFRDSLPEGTEAVLDWLAAIRPAVQARSGDPARRKTMLRRLTAQGFWAGRPLTEQETENVIHSVLAES